MQATPSTADTLVVHHRSCLLTTRKVILRFRKCLFASCPIRIRISKKSEKGQNINSISIVVHEFSQMIVQSTAEPSFKQKFESGAAAKSSTQKDIERYDIKKRAHEYTFYSDVNCKMLYSVDRIT